LKFVEKYKLNYSILPILVFTLISIIIFTLFRSGLVIWKLNQQGINTPTGTIIRGCGLPSKENKDELNCLLNSGKYVEYIQLLKSLCTKVYGKEDIWKEERYVDQALYVYGHFYYARY